MNPSAIVAGLRRTLLETLRRAIGDHEVTAMVDFPNYGNVGDSAIYLGQLAALRALGRRPPRFVCDVKRYHRAELARHVGRGAILLTGGGNFGDLWPEVQRVREDIMASFPGNRIIQLPQTINFQEAAALDRARAIVRAHPDLTLLVRDRQSLEVARAAFGPNSFLCPDMGLCLEGLRRVGPPDQDVVWLVRADQEARETGRGTTDSRLDWVDDIGTFLLSVNRRLSSSLTSGAGRVHRWALRATYEPLARQRLLRGIRMLSRGRVVVTDRLHGHILCLLLRIPHVILDDRFGKISGFRDAWTREADGAAWAQSREEALMLARELLRSQHVASR